MLINQIIKEKRKALGLTQEQVAQRLGVSTTAVHKWEKGSTYPDVTLLPALARLLQTDLNTLLSFSADLSEQEIENVVNHIDQVIREQSYAEGFQLGLDKLREYPNGERLLYMVTLYLDGALFLYGVAEQEQYKAQLQPFYERMAASTEADIQETALAMLIARYRHCGDYERAEALIRRIPEPSIDREEQLAALYTQQGAFAEAKKLWAHRVLNGVTEIQTALLHLSGIALQEERAAEAARYAQQYEAITRQFDLPEWMAANAHLQLAIDQQDSKACIAILRKMLPAMRQEQAVSTCPLYRELGSQIFFAKLADALQWELLHSEKMAFIRADAAFAELEAELS